MTRFKSPGVINYGLSGSDVCAELRAVTIDMRGASINVCVSFTERNERNRHRRKLKAEYGDCMTSYTDSQRGLGQV